MKNMREKEAERKSGTGINPEDNNRQRTYCFQHQKLLIFLLAVCTILESVIAGLISGQAEDRCAVLLFLGIFMFVLLLTGIELYRRQEDWFFEKMGNFVRFTMCYCLSCTAAVLFLFLPEFARPVMLLPLGISMTASPFFGMAAGIFHVAVYALCGQENIFVMLCDLLLLLYGCFAPAFFRKKEYIHWGILFLFQLTFGNIMIFSYLRAGQLELNVLIYGLCNGLFSAFAGTFIHQKLFIPIEEPAPAEEETEDELDEKIDRKIERIEKLKAVLSEDFDLFCAVREFSNADYLHAKKVSEISENCAHLLGADPYVAAAGGFYYRIGRMEGAPYVENGVALAKSNCLPKEVIEILEEYNGEQKLPSTIESAIVHIVDSVVGKFDVLDKTMLSSSWNQDMLVYQTLNDNSSAGLYDKSGFSMNMFLKIRDYLIKEAKMF